MIRIGVERFRQGHRTIEYPYGPPPALPDRFVGRPSIDAAGCPDGCAACVDVCPTQAVAIREGKLQVDLGPCIFCGACEDECPAGVLEFTQEHRLAARSRSDLLVGAGEAEVRAGLSEELRKVFGRSLKLRMVSAGGCNACEADANVLTTVGWDVGRFGIDFVPSPRHADGLIITGPVTQNMRAALEDTYAALADPRIVIATGACAISGGLFASSPDAVGGADQVVPVDLYVPGCPPHPLTLFDGLLRLLGRVVEDPVRFPGARRPSSEG